MIWEIVRKGWYTWKEHKITCIPFFSYGVISSAIFLLLTAFIVYKISPELPELIFTGKIAGISEKYVGNLFTEYMENLDLIFSAIMVGILVYTITETFFKAWWIKVCSDALKCNVRLGDGLKHAKSRYFPFLRFNLLIQSAIFAGAVPLYHILKGVNPNNVHSLVYSALAFFLWMLLLLGLTSLIQFLFTFVPYAIVIDGEGTLSGIRRGYRVLRASVSETVIFWLFVVFTATLVGLPFYPLRFFGLKGVLISYALSAVSGWLIVGPITTLWWIELYKRKSKML
ncbi:DUF7847 domain-containing protein [Archaeoglobus neptunius]|uniref:DUF7847 domain-containing protein n=1 Tax=Archaeoglobus neptunius TaxID=2798580 RepID=UPI0019282BFB|nr:hypothetical protein [Archaeoglobus neptunius]